VAAFRTRGGEPNKSHGVSANTAHTNGPGRAQLILWDVRTGNAICCLDAPGDPFSNLMFTPDGTRLIGQFEFDPRKARGPEDAFSLGVWDLRTGRSLQRLVSGAAVCFTLDVHSVICSDPNAVMRRIELAAASGASVPPGSCDRPAANTVRGRHAR